MLPSSERRATSTYRLPLLSLTILQAKGSFCVMPLFFSLQLLPPSTLLYTPRPKAATYSTRAAGGLVESNKMCVAAVSSIPSFDFVQVLPPSSLRHTPPRKFPTPFRLHIFGRGKSCVQLFTLQARPLTSGSNTIQYVVFIHSFGTPLVELIQDCAPSSLRKRPMSVVVMNCRLWSKGSKW